MLLSENDLTLFLKALRFAAEKHTAQSRKDGETPYINHPIAVAEILWRVGGVRDTTLLVAALLHDTVEDTDATPEEIAALFGSEVAALVMEVTDDKSLPKLDRKRKQIVMAPYKSERAKQLKIADKANNLESLVHKPPVGWSAERLAGYVNWSAQVVKRLRGVNPALEGYYDEKRAAARALYVDNERASQGDA